MSDDFSPRQKTQQATGRRGEGERDKLRGWQRAGKALGNGEENAVLRWELQHMGEDPKLSQQVLAQAVDEVSSLLPKIKNLPTPVSSWEVKVGFDYDGDPSIYILATGEDDDIKDEEVKYNKRIDSFSMIYKLVTEKIDPSIFVYVDLCVASKF